MINNEYKNTELGLLPDDWKIICLGDINTEKNQNISPLKDEIYEYYSIPAYQENNKPEIVKGSTILSQKKILKENMILFGKLNPRVEKVWKVGNYSNYKKIGSGEWITIFPNPYEVSAEYLFYLELSKFVMPIAKTLVTGSTPSRQRVDPNSFYKLKVPLPPLKEQQKIAYVLSAVKQTQEKTLRIINSLKELKKSTMKHLFTYGLVDLEDVNQIKLINTEIGKIPEHWNVTKLSDLCETYSGGTPNRGNKSYWENGIIPWAKSGELEDNEIISTEEKITKEGLENSSAKYVDEGTLLMAMYGATAGKVGLAKSKFTINQAICAMVPNKKFFSKFYFYYLILVRDKLLSMRFGGAQPNLNQQIIKDLEVPSLPLAEQQQISDVLSKIDAKIKAERGRKGALEQLFKSLLSNLMSAKIRVNNLKVS